MSRKQWSRAGIVAAVVSVVVGMGLLGFFVLAAITLNALGSNK